MASPLGEILNLVLHDTRGADLLPRLMPIAKITRGFSTAIITSEYSELSHWQRLVEVARKRRLRAATTGALSPVGIGLALLQRRMGLSFNMQQVASTTEAAELVRTRRADLAAVETQLALLHNSRTSPKFKVITTFGARRPALAGAAVGPDGCRDRRGPEACVHDQLWRVRAGENRSRRRRQVNGWPDGPERRQKHARSGKPRGDSAANRLYCKPSTVTAVSRRI